VIPAPDEEATLLAPDSVSWQEADLASEVVPLGEWTSNTSLVCRPDDTLMLRLTPVYLAAENPNVQNA
jgi:hypothetical protein